MGNKIRKFSQRNSQAQENQEDQSAHTEVDQVVDHLQLMVQPIIVPYSNTQLEISTKIRKKYTLKVKVDNPSRPQ